MKRLILLILLIPFHVLAQDISNDSLKVYLLSEVTVQSTSEEDTLQNFFKANKSATTEDILSRLQGVYLIKRGSYGQEPMLRGLSAGQLNLTIDGMKMFGACTDKMDPVTIYVEPQNLKSMTIMQGSAGSKMGSTVGGTIDMQLGQPMFSARRFYGAMGTSYQSISNGLTSYANGNITAAGSAYNFTVTYRKAHNYTSGDGHEVPYSQYEKANVSLGAKWRIGQDTLYANVLVDNGWNIGFTALPMDVGLAQARIYALTYQRARCHGLVESFRIKVYYNTVFHSMDDSHRDNITMHMDMPGESKTAGMFAEGQFQQFGRHRLSFRTDFFYNRALAEMTMYPSNEVPMYMQTWPASGRTDGGIFFEDKYSVSTNTRVKLNARLDVATSTLQPGIGKSQLEVFYPNLPATSSLLTKSFNGSIQQVLGPSVITELHAGYGERMPTMSEMFGYYLFNRNDGFDYIGNVYLRTEKSWSYDLTLTFFTGNIQVSGTGFYNYLPDYIFGAKFASIPAMTPGANGVKVYENIPSATFYGGDLNILANLNSSFRLVHVTKYTHATNHEGAPMPLIPPLSGITSLQFTRHHWNVLGECESAWSQNRINTDFGEDATAGYAVINIRGQYNFVRQRVTFAGGVENILNTYYHNHLDWGNVARPGRNIYASIRFDF